MIWDLAFLFGGLIILLMSGEWLVKGSVALARAARVPPLVIGLTIVAFGTSAPELVIGVFAALKGGDTAGIALGNVVGSNIANVLMVLGVPALLYAMVADQIAIRRSTTIMIIGTLFFIWICLNGTGPNMVTRTEGIVLCVLMVAFLAYIAYAARYQIDNDAMISEMADIGDVQPPMSPTKMMGYIGAAVIGLPLGSFIAVTNTESLALRLDIAPAFIALSVVAFGTSLPELATTIAAARQKHAGVALGNVIGSNLFNILGIMGVSALAAKGGQIPVPNEFRFIDLWIMLGCALLIGLYTFDTFTKRRIGRVSGALFLLAYVMFIALVFIPMKQH